jgi:hypothetical protein
VFITAVPIIKVFAWGEGKSGGHVLRGTTSRGLCGLVCPSRTSERGGEGDWPGDWPVCAVWPIFPFAPVGFKEVHP